MTVILTLGPVLFQDFEVPEKISVGGEHSLVVHKLVGRARVVDAMGRDDAAKARARRLTAVQQTMDVTHGKFSGANACKESSLGIRPAIKGSNGVATEGLARFLLSANPLKKLVGATGFEPATPSPPD